MLITRLSACTCVYFCKYVFVYLSVYACTCMYRYTYMYAFVRVHAHVCIPMCACVRTHVCTCINVCVYVCTYMKSVHICVNVYVYVHSRKFLRNPTYKYMQACVRVCMLHSCMCVHVSVCSYRTDETQTSFRRKAQRFNCRESHFRTDWADARIT